MAQGRSNVDAVRRELEREQKVNEIKAEHLKAACWDIMAVPEAKILPVGQTSLISGLADYQPTDEMNTCFAARNLAPVSNMPVRKLSEAETQRLQEARTSHTNTVQCVPLYTIVCIWLFAMHAIIHILTHVYTYLRIYISICVYCICIYVYIMLYTYIYGCFMHTQNGSAQHPRGVCLSYL